MEFDLTTILGLYINNKMLKDKRSVPMVKLLNKYGIYGIKAANFMLELVEVLKEMGENNDQINSSR